MIRYYVKSNDIMIYSCNITIIRWWVMVGLGEGGGLSHMDRIWLVWEKLRRNDAPNISVGGLECCHTSGSHARVCVGGEVYEVYRGVWKGLWKWDMISSCLRHTDSPLPCRSAIGHSLNIFPWPVCLS